LSTSAFLPGGATGDAALARAELGVQNAKRIAEEAEKKREAKKRKKGRCIVQVHARLSGVIGSNRLASGSSKAQATRAHRFLHLSVFRRNLKGQPKKCELIAALSPEISKELQQRIQQPEPHAELPGVPVPVPVNENDAELPEMAQNQPAPATQTTLEPPPTGANDTL